MYGFAWPYLESLLLKNCLLLSLKIYFTVNVTQHSKRRAFNPVIEVQCNPDFTDASGNISSYSDGTKIFFHYLYWFSCFHWIPPDSFLFLWITKKCYFDRADYLYIWKPSVHHLCSGSYIYITAALLCFHHFICMKVIALQLYKKCTKAELQNVLLVLFFLLIFHSKNTDPASSHPSGSIRNAHWPVLQLSSLVNMKSNKKILMKAGTVAK